MIPSDLSQATGREVRLLCRRGEFDAPTAGLAAGFVQANLVILREHLAGDFEQFCRLNPQPCPLLEVTRAGQFSELTTAADADLRTDLPAYRVFQDGELVSRTTSIETFWQPDFVAFIIGCSFTFEAALLEAGLPVRHVEDRCNVPMYRTNIACKGAGPFTSPMVVSMRPMTPEQADRAAHITSCYPRAHGAPVHIGDPHRIGIVDVGKPDYGDAVTIRPREIPVFWACGVTPMEAIRRARPDVAITHDPGHMLVTDLRDEELREETKRH